MAGNSILFRSLLKSSSPKSYTSHSVRLNSLRSGIEKLSHVSFNKILKSKIFKMPRSFIPFQSGMDKQSPILWIIISVKSLIDIFPNTSLNNPCKSSIFERISGRFKRNGSPSKSLDFNNSFPADCLKLGSNFSRCNPECDAKSRTECLWSSPIIPSIFNFRLFKSRLRFGGEKSSLKSPGKFNFKKSIHPVHVEPNTAS